MGESKHTPDDLAAMAALFGALWRVTITEPVSDGNFLRELVGERELAGRNLRWAGGPIREPTGGNRE